MKRMHLLTCAALATALPALALAQPPARPNRDVAAQQAPVRTTAQPSEIHMHQAIADLMAAKNELNQANRNKAGHRKRAVELVDQTIAEVQAGIAASAGNQSTNGPR